MPTKAKSLDSARAASSQEHYQQMCEMPEDEEEGLLAEDGPVARVKGFNDGAL